MIWVWAWLPVALALVCGYMLGFVRGLRAEQRVADARRRELQRRYELFRQQAPDIDSYFESYKPTMMKQYPGLTFEQARDLTLRLANGDRYWE